MDSHSREQDPLMPSGSSPYYQPPPSAFPLDAGYRHHLDAAGFSFQMGPNPHHHIAHGQGQPHLRVETSSPPKQQQPPALDAADARGDEQQQGMKKKRGRPRKYKPDGAVTLGLSSPSSASASGHAAAPVGVVHLLGGRAHHAGVWGPVREAEGAPAGVREDAAARFPRKIFTRLCWNRIYSSCYHCPIRRGLRREKNQ